MQSKVNNICKVQYATLASVTDYVELPGGRVIITATWQDLPNSRPPELLINEEIGKAGRLYVCNFTAALTESRLIKHGLVVKISFDDGAEPMIIGDPSLPVRLLEQHELKNKSIRFTHNSWHYPFRTLVATPVGSNSGSGSSGM
ncbi:hypothetical protein [Mongoliitalea lutea]|uniref:Uncharacterized protein n=1 Tax=Mongoliitalea lutea TaxID=849756 RepID=A0A8J3CZM6_9BACT|nr:hypothetical protein [Mongoliitalea lutea]GHB44494.1 hypothetical protein GCM10008106_26960 [Mongoliitalea lutea]